ncbi:MAG: 1-deoxy-D-xylulose-5-phosphate reductoisomerase [Gammaproteobacteria bacterium]|nr:1-deoxy-D-xylulose-5-phosphate reductoisomerase [Gammaproteobacteria bacterium]
MKGVAILGSTGTIGVNTLDVVARNPEHFKVVSLSANHDVERMVQQCLKWRPEVAVMADENAALELERRLRVEVLQTRVLAGVDGLCECVALAAVDQVMAGIVGAAGLMPTLAAARAGKRVLLANKEALVMSGGLFLDAVRGAGAELLPIDSEHNAIFQCLPAMAHARWEQEKWAHAEQREGVRRILLTGSGGPFRTRDPESLWSVTPDEACAHPNWVMGRKISVDSATMMNKGLEFIEACLLFRVTPDKVEVVIHPQSIVHSMVEYHDGSVLAQMGNPDMRTSIAHAMAWPDRVSSGVAPLDFHNMRGLDFEAPDYNRFPCLRLALEAARASGEASTIINAANEVAVGAFLAGELSFPHIGAVIEECLAQANSQVPASLDEVLMVDQAARARARASVVRLGAA